jgi:hypothetical protein
MENKDNNDPEIQKKKTDPQQDEQEGNILGKPFEKLFGDSEGEGAVGEDEDKEPGKQGSIKH